MKFLRLGDKEINLEQIVFVGSADSSGTRIITFTSGNTLSVSGQHASEVWTAIAATRTPR